MQKEEKLKRIEEVVKVACPELMEMSFGCFVKYSNHGNQYTTYLTRLDKRSTDSKSLMRKYGCASTIDSFSVEVWNTAHDYPYVVDKDTFETYKEIMEHVSCIDEILGHPIRLSHVLRAMDRTRYQARTLGDKTTIVFGDSMGEKCVDWNLTQDDLSLQSPETIDFLFKILCE